MQEALRFGRFTVLPVERQLLADGQPLALGARAFDVLLALIERRHQLATKNELLDAVWPGLAVEESNLATQVSLLRKTLGPQVIATIPGRGYRFAAALEGDAVVPLEAGNVPAAADPLIGREAEVAAVLGWLAEHRVVTLLGTGGIGKTRLAQAVAYTAGEGFPHGAWWVDLTAAGAADGLAPAVAQVLQVSLAGGGAAQLAQALAPRRLLLVLDNCEHLAAGVAALLQTLLAAAPGVRVLATSQEALRVAGEQLYRLPPLPVPAPGATLAEARSHAALQLLEARVRALAPAFAIAETNLASAAELCRRLDGLPLAIEMAAARIPLLGLEGLHAKLGQRLDLLRAANRGAPTRQQTLRAALEFSHALLTADEQAVLRRLSVFAGSFGLAAALEVGAGHDLDEWAALEALGGLIDKSFVKLERLEPPRYRLAETLKLYAGERLQAAAEGADATARHGSALAARANQAARDHAPEDEWLDRYADDAPDLAAAFRRACERGDGDVAAAAITTLRALDELRGLRAATRSQLEAAYAMLPHASLPGRARLYSYITSCGWVAVEGKPRLDAAREAVRCWREHAAARSAQSLPDAHGEAPLELHHALARLATELARGGDFDAADAAIAEARALERPDWPPPVVGRRALREGWVALFRNDNEHFRAHWVEARRCFVAGGARRMAAFAGDGIAYAAMAAGELEQAVRLAREVVREMTALNHPSMLANALGTLCQALLLSGDAEGGRAAAAQALPLLEQSGQGAFLLNEATLLAAMTGQHERGALLLGRAPIWQAANEVPNDATEQRLADEAAARLAAALGETELERLRSAGRQLDDAQTAALLRAAIGP